MSIILRNGQTWENKDGERAIAQWLGGDLWCLLCLPVESVHGGTCMLPFTSADGKTIYPEVVLADTLAKHHWRRIPNFGMQIPLVDADAPTKH